jgi:Na+/phosphate symporter
MDAREIRSQAAAMAGKICQILDLIEKGFMEHRTEYLAQAVQKEHEINESERALTLKILELSKSSKDRKGLIALQQAIEMLERMGDEALGLIERIEIKISEKLLFSEEGVAQFNETYGVMKKSVHMMKECLEKGDSTLKDRIVDNGFTVKALVERYRKEHTERLLHGICTPIAANMYFDMLDFTGNLARHASSIIKAF